MRFASRLASLTPYVPGAPIDLVLRQFGLSEAVKLASNEFPLPPFDEVKAAVAQALDDLNRYPDGDATDLRRALATHFAREPEQVIIGNGSCELLMLLGDALLEPGDEVVFADPSFVVYNDICLLHEAVARPVPLVDYCHDVMAMAAAVGPRTKMVIVCNPNNPTGTYVPAAAIAELVRTVPDDVLIVLDEAYNEFVGATDSQEALELQATHENVCVLRTFSKIYGLCGLRVGYGLGSADLKAGIDKVRQPFNVNVLGQVAAREALRHQDLVAERARTIREQRAYMVDRLAHMGRATVPSEANFVLVDIRDLKYPQDEVCNVLMSRGAIVRDGNALGCPGWARVSVGTRDEIDYFLSQLESLNPVQAGATEGRSS
ncbi:MAG: histidinol-phosphate transaminase [Thermoleophilia bacterium]